MVKWGIFATNFVKANGEVYDSLSLHKVD